MELVSPELIEKIDKFAEEKLNISQIELMGRSASAAFCALEKGALDSDRVVILCGKGNNGGDGYALALLAMKKYNVTAVDVFGSGQRSEAGRYYLNKYANSGGNIISGLGDLSFLDRADVIVDAIFGTGMRGECPSELSELVERINGSEKKVIAIDIPLGVNSYDGSISGLTLKADITVVLSFMKIGTVSYPAREFLGEIVFSDLGLPKERIISEFQIRDHLTDASLVRKILGQRGKNTNKGSFGKALLITGSDRYEGAGRLSLEAALRGGAGIVGYCSSYALRDRMIKDFPEAIYYPLTDEDFNGRQAAELSARHTSTLIGSGSGISRELYEMTEKLITAEGGPLVLDADAINSLARFGSAELLKKAKRRVILTPHPMEFSRISGIGTEEINSARIKVAREFAKEHNCILVLKGAGTVITDGERVFINSSGSSALAKGGSGDALAGLMVSLLAFLGDPFEAAIAAVYIHGAAGDKLAEEYSEYGVTPSDLPKEMARAFLEIGRTEK